MSNEDTVSFAPHPSIIGSYQAKQQPWWLMIAELIDNSFDAKASTVRITVTKDSITVEDDGVGCGNIVDMITFGAHDARGRITSGMWGVGGTSAMIWIAKETQIETIHGGVKQTLRIKWNEVKAMKEWRLPRPASFPCDAASRTKISMVGLRTSKPDWKEIIPKLGAVFRYGLEDNRRIVVALPGGDQLTVPIPRDPLFTKVHERTVDISSGRQLKIRAGIVAREQINHSPGLTYVYAHRVLINNSAIGLGDGDGMAAIAGSVRLVPEEKWKKCLPTNKDGLGALEQEIDIAVTAELERSGLLAEAKAQSEELHTKYLEQEISDGMTEALLQNVKEKRNPKNDSATKEEPEQTDKKRKRAKRVQPGERSLAEMRRNGIRLAFAHIGDDGGSFGIADISKRIVTLSLDSPYIKKLHDRKDRLLIAREAFQVYLDKLAWSEDPESRAQQVLFQVSQHDARQRFMEMLSKILKDIDFDQIAGRKLVAA